ncbi:Glycosyl transferase CAP10 domain - like 6 [Theobroma cacao]|nr:Glycosyl transferase CAP10 domain - like 6 [Theobroma cacao]
MIERGKSSAVLRLMIVNGKVYMEKSYEPYQTRDLFTLWGILQLLRFYPRMLLDLDLLSFTGDKIMIRKREAEVNIMPWEKMSAIKNCSKRIKWEDRVTYAYWKGNPIVSLERKGLLKCNLLDKYDWNARFYINATIDDSITLMIKPRYYDFFSRNMVPMQLYWPIRNTSKCRDLKFAAQAIGKARSKLIEEFLTMRNIYDYMVRSKTIARSEKMKCLGKEYMEQSMVKSPGDKFPCAWPPPYEPQAL